MSANLIDFPPGRKKRCLLQDIPLLPKDLVLPPQPLRRRRDLALCGRGVDSAPIPAPADPADRRRPPDPKITSDLALRATAGLRQADRFLLKFLGKPALLCHRVPHRSLGTLHFFEASPPAPTPLREADTHLGQRPFGCANRPDTNPQPTRQLRLKSALDPRRASTQIPSVATASLRTISLPDTSAAFNRS